MLISKDFTRGRALLDTVGVWGSNPHAPTNVFNNLAPPSYLSVTPDYAIRIKKSDDLPCEPQSFIYSRLKKGSRGPRLKNSLYRSLLAFASIVKPRSYLADFEPDYSAVPTKNPVGTVTIEVSGIGCNSRSKVNSLVYSLILMLRSSFRTRARVCERTSLLLS